MGTYLFSFPEPQRANSEGGRGRGRARAREDDGRWRVDPVEGLISVHVQKQIFCLFLFAGFGGLCFTVLQVLVSLLRILADIGTEW